MTLYETTKVNIEDFIETMELVSEEDLFQEFPKTTPEEFHGFLSMMPKFIQINFIDYLNKLSIKSLLKKKFNIRPLKPYFDTSKELLTLKSNITKLKVPKFYIDTSSCRSEWFPLFMSVTRSSNKANYIDTYFDGLLLTTIPHLAKVLSYSSINLLIKNEIASDYLTTVIDFQKIGSINGKKFSVINKSTFDKTVKKDLIRALSHVGFKKKYKSFEYSRAAGAPYIYVNTSEKYNQHRELLIKLADRK